MKRRFLALLLGVSLGAVAQEQVEVCYNWSCVARVDVRFSLSQWQEVTRFLSWARDAASERGLLAQAIGRLYRWAGEQSPIRNDRAGNATDAESDGRMDCIDHSTTTTRFLRRLEAAGALRWHRVLEPARRSRYIVTQHFAAAIEEQPGGERFVVDSWFVDNGQPAVVLPLEAWKEGEGPSVE